MRDVMLKILQARLQQYVNRELPDVQAGFRKGRETEIKLATSDGSSKKQESSRKSSLVVKTLPPNAWSTGLIPGQRAKNPRSHMPHSHKTKT